MLYLVSLTAWSYTMLYRFTIYEVKMLRFYNVQTTNLIFVGKKEMQFIDIPLSNSK